MKYHPDKNIGKEDTVRGMFEETTVKLQNLREAHDPFLASGGNFLSGRYYYDLKCAFLVSYSFSSSCFVDVLENDTLSVSYVL